jgi:hypothetical protein
MNATQNQKNIDIKQLQAFVALMAGYGKTLTQPTNNVLICVHWRKNQKSF